MATKRNKDFLKRIPELSEDGKEFADKLVSFFHNYHATGIYVLYEFLAKDFDLLLYIVSARPSKYSDDYFLSNVKHILQKNIGTDYYLQDYLKARIIDRNHLFIRSAAQIPRIIKDEEGHKLKKVCEEWFKKNYHKEIPKEILDTFEK